MPLELSYTTFGHSSLFGCIGLTHFDSSGFIVLETIGNDFLNHCRSLTHFNTSGLTSLQAIGDNLFLNSSIKTITAFKEQKALLEPQIPSEIKRNITWELLD